MQPTGLEQPLNTPNFASKAILWLKKYKLAVTLVLIALLPLIIYFFLSLFYRIESKYAQYSYQKQQEENKKKQQEEYQKLLEKQEQRSKKSQTKQSEEKEERKKATGDYNLYFVSVKPPTLPRSAITPLINKLKEQNDQIFTSLLYINTFYKQAAKKYGIENFNLHTSFYGVYDLASLEKVGDAAYIWGKDPFGTVKLRDSFDNLLIDNSINTDENTLVIFLYFDDSFGEGDPYAADRFYEHKKFRSFANEYEGRAYINVYNFNPNFAQTVTEIIAHETLHLFGATDKYEESVSISRICSERGRGDLDLQPILPQKTTDLFCMYIEKENDKFERARFSDNNIVINKITAKEIGWIHQY